VLVVFMSWWGCQDARAAGADAGRVGVVDCARPGRRAGVCAVEPFLAHLQALDQGSGRGVVIPAWSGPGFNLVAQGEVGAGVAGKGPGQTTATAATRSPMSGALVFAQSLVA
jgi:hypothetical protein